ncbi:hypothetical protein CPB86DRAFT_305287 [Serendipita vermifera]|nr:hypothetical protein CPB86DRAFT_305287 [Serendipita vermifera]
MDRPAKKLKRSTGCNVDEATNAPEPQQSQTSLSMISKDTTQNIHDAIKSGGIRLVGNSVDFDDIYIDTPDDAVLNIDSILSILFEEPFFIQRDGNAGVTRRATLEYLLWVACRKAVDLYPYDGRMEPSPTTEKRTYYALQHFLVGLGVEMLARLPNEGLLHVPVDCRISQNVLDIIKNTLYLVESFVDEGIESSRLVFDIPATNAGIYAGRFLSFNWDISVNFTHVCDLTQASACLEADPYGLSVPLKMMKRVEDLRARISSSGPHDVRNLNDHPAFEVVRSITRFAEMHAPDTVVCARDVENCHSISALTCIHAIAPTNDLMRNLRWHGHLRSDEHLFSTLTDDQFRKTEVALQRVQHPFHSVQQYSTASALKIAKPNFKSDMQKGDKDRMSSEEIREAIDDRLKGEVGEVKMNTMRPPQVLRRYINNNSDWIYTPGLPQWVIPIGPFQSKNPNIAGQGKLPAPPSFLSFMPTHSKKHFLYVMEASLEEECKSMANLHRYVQEVLNRKFASLFVEVDNGGKI